MKDNNRIAICLFVALASLFGLFAFPIIAVSNENDSNFVEIFRDDFEDGNAAGWQFTAAGGEEKDWSSTWKIENEGSNHVLSGEEHTHANIISKNLEVTDFSLETKFKFIREDAGFHLNVRDGKEGRYSIQFGDNSVILSKDDRIGLIRLSGLYKMYAQFNSNTWYTAKILITGNNIKVYVNELLKIDYIDADKPLLSGGINFETFTNAHIHFDDARVLAPAQPMPSKTNFNESTSIDFLARLTAIVGFIILIILTVIFPKKNCRTKLSSYVIAGLSTYGILDIVGGWLLNAFFVVQNDLFLVVFGGLGAAVFGILSRDIRMTASLAIRGFISWIIGFAILWFVIVRDKPGGSSEPVIIGIVILIWGCIHGIGLGSIYKSLKKTSVLAGASILGVPLALASSEIYPRAILGVHGDPLGYGILGGVFGATIGIGMYYVSVQKTEIQTEPEIEAEPLESKPVSPEEFFLQPTTPRTFPPELQPKYTDIEFLGKGGFARVFKAKRKSNGKVVAVKIPISLDEATGKSFLKEIKAWEEMKHHNIVELYDMNIMPLPYFEMEYVENKSLEELKKPVEVEKAARIVFDLAGGLKYAHARGIIHRDLKPHNVLLTNDMIPKITDWGLSKVLAEGKTSSMADFSPVYAAPEQISPKQFGKTDVRTDIYQLGVIFYELITGKLPFFGESVAEITSAIINEKPVPPSIINPEAMDVEEIILRCLEKKKEERYQSAEELQKALAEYLKQECKKSLKESSDKKDITRSRLFCGDLVLISAKLGDYTEVLKYLSVLKDYAKPEEKTDIENLMNELSFRLKESIRPSEDFVDRIKILAYRVQMKYKSINHAHQDLVKIKWRKKYGNLR